MIRKLLATTAFATLVATGAFAQATTTEPAAAPEVKTTAPADANAPVEAAKPSTEGHLASNFIGETVYNGTGDDAQNIGDINDLVIGEDGSVQAIVVGVGGFLGLGEKDVAIEFKSASWAERNGDRWVVVNATADELKALPAFDRTVYNPAPAVAANEPTAPGTGMTPAPAPSATPAPAEQQAAETKPAAEPAAPAETDATKTGAIDKSTLTALPVEKISADQFVGTTVYGANDEMIGEINDVALTTDGKVDAVIIDVGGFLGMGEKQVAVGMDNLNFMSDKDGNRYLYSKFTKEQLEAQPAYDKATFAQKRDEQLLIVR